MERLTSETSQVSATLNLNVRATLSGAWRESGTNCRRLRRSQDDARTIIRTHSLSPRRWQRLHAHIASMESGVEAVSI